MSKPSHTPGPWVIDRLESASGVVGIDSIGPIYADHDRFSDCAVIVASDANAHLIAAAPDLYAALEALRHAVCGETGFAACVRVDTGKAYPWPALDEAEAIVNAALAKARGEA